METHVDTLHTFSNKLGKRSGKVKRDKGYRSIAFDDDFDGDDADDDGDRNLVPQITDTLHNNNNNKTSAGSSGSRSATPVSFSPQQAISTSSQRTSQFYTNVSAQQPLPSQQLLSTEKASPRQPQFQKTSKTHTVSSVSTRREIASSNPSSNTASDDKNLKHAERQYPSLSADNNDQLGGKKYAVAAPVSSSRDPFRLLKPSAEVATKRKTSGGTSASLKQHLPTSSSARQKSASGKALPHDRQQQYEVFGVPLYVALERQPVSSVVGVILPAFVRELIAALEDRGLDTEGLYRISGSNSKKAELRASINKACYRADPARHPLDLSAYDPTVIADVLKQWLRELPEPIIPFDVQKKLRDPCDKFERKGIAESVGKIRHLLATTMPECNFYLLSYVFIHMAHVLQHSRYNKMSVLALGTILDPVVKICGGRILVILLEHAEEIFHGVDYRPALCSSSVSGGMPSSSSSSQQKSTPQFLSPMATTTTAASGVMTSRARLASSSSRTSVTADLPERKDALEKEIVQHEALLMRLHSIIKHKPDDKELNEQLWDKQRYVTAMKRKLKELQRKQSQQQKLQQQHTVQQPGLVANTATSSVAAGDAILPAAKLPLVKPHSATTGALLAAATTTSLPKTVESNNDSNSHANGQADVKNADIAQSAGDAIDRRRLLRELHYQFRMEDILHEEMRMQQIEFAHVQEKLWASQAKNKSDGISTNDSTIDEQQQNTPFVPVNENSAEHNDLIDKTLKLVKRCEKYEERNNTLRSQILQESDIIASSRAWILTDKFKEYEEEETSSDDDAGLMISAGDFSDSDVVDGAIVSASTHIATVVAADQPAISIEKPDISLLAKHLNNNNSNSAAVRDEKSTQKDLSTFRYHQQRQQQEQTTAAPVLRAKPEAAGSRLKRQRAHAQQQQKHDAAALSHATAVDAVSGLKPVAKSSGAGNSTSFKPVIPAASGINSSRDVRTRSGEANR